MEIIVDLLPRGSSKRVGRDGLGSDKTASVFAIGFVGGRIKRFGLDF